ncbi:4Fe-4S dicluster domain-containing protein [Desulfovibrio sp. OttesenSCG-928-A18]|nr:4Fe-4S dicluster domain-containing protein [Desulfovibrio sp. OttesenSCG-928-A18]
MSVFLRPPGVVSEKDFKSRCISCGQCAQVCNYACIELTPDHLFFGGETPKVFHRKSPCFLCMKCSAICPTGALRDVRMENAGMGMAFLNLKKCVDYQDGSGVMCWTCHDKCPLRGNAITLQYGYIPVIHASCVGCGVCEYVCPIHAIEVRPARLLPPDAQAPSDGEKS